MILVPQESIAKLEVGTQFKTRFTNESLRPSPIEGSSFCTAELLDDKGKAIGLVEVLIDKNFASKATKSDTITVIFDGMKMNQAGTRNYPVFTAYRELPDA